MMHEPLTCISNLPFTCACIRQQAGHDELKIGSYAIWGLIQFNLRNFDLNPGHICPLSYSLWLKVMAIQDITLRQNALKEKDDEKNNLGASSALEEKKELDACMVLLLLPRWMKRWQCFEINNKLLSNLGYFRIHKRTDLTNTIHRKGIQFVIRVDHKKITRPWKSLGLMCSDKLNSFKMTASSATYSAHKETKFNICIAKRPFLKYRIHLWNK